jgi:hypothetical protein
MSNVPLPGLNCIESFMDSSREIRSMIMASFPCPPLPMESSSRFLNSHDLLAYLIDVAARRDDKKDNSQREKNQVALLVQYNKDIKECHSEKETWDVMTSFTRLYMMTYHSVLHETRFLTFDSVAPPLKKQVCSWLAAQHILRGDSEARGDMFEGLEPWQLYQRCRDMVRSEAEYTEN